MTKNSRILHFVQDEKFTDVAIELFESAFPKQNRYLVGKSILNPQMAYVKSEVSLHYLHRFSAGYLARIAEDADVVFFHGLGPLHAAIFEKMRRKDHAVCLFYGGEIYNNPKVYPHPILGPKTAQLGENEPQAEPQTWFRKLLYGDLFVVKDEAKLFLELQHFACLFREEMVQLQDLGVLSKNCMHFSFAFGHLDQLPPIRIEESDPKNYVLLGNSASNTNNHLEVFDQLSHLPSDLTILVPLSYGDKQYRDQIIAEGKSIFGPQFEPMVDFKDFETYQSLLEQCRVAIFNHYRQQALGNILSLLWLGAKVYLSSKNPLTRALQMAGFRIFIIEHDLADERFEPLSVAAIQKNRSLLQQIFSLEQIVEGIRNSLAAILGEEKL